MPEGGKNRNFHRSPMFPLAISFAAGILASGVIEFDLKTTLSACAVAAVASLLVPNRPVGTVLLLTAFGLAGVSLSIVEKQSVAPDRLKILYDNGTIRSGDPVEIEGVLIGRPEPSIDASVLTLNVERIAYRGTQLAVSGKVRLFMPAVSPGGQRTERVDHLALKHGSKLRIACRLEREDGFLNPGVIPKREMLDRLTLDAVGSVKSDLLVEKIADESVFIPLGWVRDQRVEMIEGFRNNLSGPAAGVMIASLLGDRYFLDKTTADLFREGGTFHILVISGLHVTFIGGLLLWLVRQTTRNRWVQFLVTAIGLWAYALAVGADVPVVRAALMFTAISFAFVAYRDGSGINALGLCALVLLVWRPSDLFNPSFQLTFVSVTSLVVIAFPLIDKLRQIGTWTPSPQQPFPPDVPAWLRRSCETLHWSEDAWKFESKRQIWTVNLFKFPFLAGRIKQGLQTVARYLVEGLLVSLIVQVCMLPLSVVYFHRVSVISVLLNLWVGFFIALESFAAVIGVLVNQISSLLATGFFMLAEMFSWLMFLLPRLFADNGWVSFRLPAYSGYGRAIYFLYFLPIILLAFILHRWNPFDLKPRGLVLRPAVLYPAFVAFVLLSGIIVFHPFSAPNPDGRLHVDFLDVGQGDSALVTFPNGKTLLIDGGGRMKYRARVNEEAEPFEPDIRGVGEAVVAEFLWHRGYSWIDHILATHAHADHLEGLTDVAKNFTIGSAVFGRAPLDDLQFAELADVLRRRGTAVETIARGHLLTFGDVMIEVLHPTASDDAKALSENDNSVVLRIIYGNRAFLLTGDIERQAETDLINSIRTLSADLIKVPHHGSRTSSTQEFVDKVGAKHTIISVGRSSSFGHPHEDVVDRWKVSGAEVMTTGEKGTISVSTDGKDFKIKTFIP